VCSFGGTRNINTSSIFSWVLSCQELNQLNQSKPFGLVLFVLVLKNQPNQTKTLVFSLVVWRAFSIKIKLK